MITGTDERNRFPPLGSDPASVRQRVEALERVMERLFVVPGINRQIGLDVILDVVPVVGSTAAAAIGAFVVWEARNLGLSKWQIARMSGNIGIDWLLGLATITAPIDWLFRSNSRYLKMIKRHLDKLHPAGATVPGEVLRR
jgi:hypothetical protein